MPGGQQVYIDPRGLLSFTQAHSASIPRGSIVDGFTLKMDKNTNVISLANSAGNWVACPEKNARKGRYQIGIEKKGSDKLGCLRFTAETDVLQPKQRKPKPVFQYI